MDKFLEFLKLIDKLLKFPQMTLSEKETELIKEVLSKILEDNPNYGPKTKRIFKEMLDAANNSYLLYKELEAYIMTNDITQ